MARPKEQAARRRDIIAAARRAIGVRGVRGLRIKDVGAEARVSAGLITYYFPDLDRLLVEVHQDCVDRFYWERLRAIDGLEGGVARLRALVSHGLPSGPGDEVCHALYELHLHASRDEAHAALMSTLFDREVAVYSDVLRQGQDRGEFSLAAPAADIATNTVALEDAFGLHIVARNRSIDRSRATTLLLEYLGVVTGVDALRRPLGPVSTTAAPFDRAHG